MHVDTIGREACKSAADGAAFGVYAPECQGEVDCRRENNTINSDIPENRLDRLANSASESRRTIGGQESPDRATMFDPLSVKGGGLDTIPQSNLWEMGVQSSPEGVCGSFEPQGWTMERRNEQSNHLLEDRSDTVPVAPTDLSKDKASMGAHFGKQVDRYPSEETDAQARPERFQCIDHGVVHPCQLSRGDDIDKGPLKAPTPKTEQSQGNEGNHFVCAEEREHEEPELEDISLEKGSLLEWVQKEVKELSKASRLPAGQSLSDIDSVDCKSVGGSSTSSLSYTSSQIHGLSQLHERVMDVLPVLSSRGFKFSFKVRPMTIL